MPRMRATTVELELPALQGARTDVEGPFGHMVGTAVTDSCSTSEQVQFTKWTTAAGQPEPALKPNPVDAALASIEKEVGHLVLTFVLDDCSGATRAAARAGLPGPDDREHGGGA